MPSFDISGLTIVTIIHSLKTLYKKAVIMLFLIFVFLFAESENATPSNRGFLRIPLLWRSSNQSAVKLHPTLSSQIRVQIEGKTKKNSKNCVGNTVMLFSD